jgi:hypothetical protein
MRRARNDSVEKRCYAYRLARRRLAQRAPHIPFAEAKPLTELTITAEDSMTFGGSIVTLYTLTTA